MADSSGSSRPTSASSKPTKVVRSQKISSMSSPPPPSPDENQKHREREESLDKAPPTRSHTPGHLSNKHQGSSPSDRRRRASEASIRHRSQSAVTSKPPPTPQLNGMGADGTNTPPAEAPPSRGTSVGDGNGSGKESGPGSRRTVAIRSSSAVIGRPASTPPRKSSAPPKPQAPRTSYLAFPPLLEPPSSGSSTPGGTTVADAVPPAPSSGMYWSRAAVSGAPHPPLRAHTATLVGSNVFVFGGCDARTCFNQLYVLDADSFHWSRPHVSGDVPPPLRAMTCTAVGRKLVIFGGGDGPSYHDDVYVLDTTNFRWSRPRISGGSGPVAQNSTTAASSTTSSPGLGGAEGSPRAGPSPRRAHTACLYRNGIYVFGGGDGVRALNDIWRLDVTDTSKMSWRLVSSPTTSVPGRESGKPRARGYHTANMVGSKLIIYGGSDGGECFNDVWVFDADTLHWRGVSIPVTFRRLSHTSTLVGSYLFVVGGHDGSEYSNEVLLLNLVTMTWDRRRVYGLPPTGRGYHGTVLYDSRLISIGGFDGTEVFGDVWVLELAVHAYYSQISHFTIEV